MYNIGITSEMRVVGQDSEFADIDNPNGDIIREVYFVTATTTEGRIYQHFYWSQEREAINLLANKIKATIMHNPEWKPIEGRWTHVQNVYGSPAYVEDGSEAKLSAWERAQEDLL